MIGVCLAAILALCPAPARASEHTPEQTLGMTVNHLLNHAHRYVSHVDTGAQVIFKARRDGVHQTVVTPESISASGLTTCPELRYSTLIPKWRSDPYLFGSELGNPALSYVTVQWTRTSVPLVFDGPADVYVTPCHDQEATP